MTKQLFFLKGSDNSNVPSEFRLGSFQYTVDLNEENELGIGAKESQQLMIQLTMSAENSGYILNHFYEFKTKLKT